MAGIGIDLGSSNSSVALIQNGEPLLFPPIPSVVSVMPNGHVVVGEEAKSQRFLFPERTFQGFKRLVGTGHSVEVDGVRYSAEQMTSFVLRQLLEDAERRLGHPLREAAIAVPIYYNEQQREAIHGVATSLGIGAQRILNEPTAAAIAYGLDQAPPRCVLVVDLGGETLDVTVLWIGAGAFEIWGTASEAFGADTYHLRLADLLMELMAEEREQYPQVVAIAEGAKLALSQHTETVVRFQDREYGLTRAQFESITQELNVRVQALIERVLKSVAGHPSSLILVGGATQLPSIRRAIEKVGGLEPLAGIPPEHVVVIGAALQSSRLW